VTSLKISAASGELVVDLFHTIAPEIATVVEEKILSALQDGRLFDPSELALSYGGESAFWLQQERTLLVGGGGFRELRHNVSVFDWDRSHPAPIWDIARCRRRLNAFDVTLTMPNTERGSRWHLAERIGEALGLGDIRDLVRRAPRESLSILFDEISTEIAPGVAVRSRQPATPEERLKADRAEQDRLRNSPPWLPSSVELSEPLYGEMRGVLSTLDQERADDLISSGLVRYVDRFVQEVDDLDEKKLGIFATKLARPIPIAFGRTMALGEFEGQHPLNESRVEHMSQSGDEAHREEDMEEAQMVDSLTSVEIQAVPSPLGDCTVAFSSASQELFASALYDAPEFDEEKPVMQIRYPDFVDVPTEKDLVARSALTQAICKRVDHEFNLREAIGKLEAMGFNAHPATGAGQETQYSRGKIKLTFEG
jgi:hypothetical protein